MNSELDDDSGIAASVVRWLLKGAAVAGAVVAGWLCMSGTASALEITPPSISSTVESAATVQSTATETITLTASTSGDPVSTPEATVPQTVAVAEVAKTSSSVISTVEKSAAAAAETVSSTTRTVQSAGDLVVGATETVARTVTGTVTGVGDTAAPVLPVLETATDTAIEIVRTTPGPLGRAIDDATGSKSMLLDSAPAGARGTVVQSTKAIAEGVGDAVPLAGRVVDVVDDRRGVVGAHAPTLDLRRMWGAAVLGSAAAAAPPAASGAIPVAVQGFPAGPDGSASDAVALATEVQLSAVRTAQPLAPNAPVPAAPLDGLLATALTVVSSGGFSLALLGFVSLSVLFGLSGGTLIRAADARALQPDGVEPPVSPA